MTLSLTILKCPPAYGGGGMRKKAELISSKEADDARLRRLCIEGTERYLAALIARRRAGSSVRMFGGGRHDYEAGLEFPEALTLTAL